MANFLCCRLPYSVFFFAAPNTKSVYNVYFRLDQRQSKGEEREIEDKGE